jgi:hypothetical protein
MLEFIPLHLTTHTRCSGVLPWMTSWLLPSHSLIPLEEMLFANHLAVSFRATTLATAYRALTVA